ncbi:MAG TPA: hypothetical protein VLM42_12140 [Bryobacteraceae bacterium]|nr:hypothetical protein [Bryobacteraceae bacterium]
MSKPLLLLFAIVLANAQAPANLAGRWRSVETSQGGIGAVYQFHADGTFDFSPGAIVDMPYRVAGDQLILPPATTTGPEIKSKLTVSGDVLRLALPDHVSEYHRRGKVQDLRDPLLGEWLGSREMDGRQMIEQMFFYPGGKSLLVILFTTQRGIYSTSGGRLVATFGGRTGLNGPFDISEGVLSIHRGGGRITKLARY